MKGSNGDWLCTTHRETTRELKYRLRKTAQILIDKVGADGPMNAEDAALKAVDRICELEDEVALSKKRLLEFCTGLEMENVELMVEESPDILHLAGLAMTQNVKAVKDMTKPHQEILAAVEKFVDGQMGILVDGQMGILAYEEGVKDGYAYAIEDAKNTGDLGPAIHARLAKEMESGSMWPNLPGVKDNRTVEEKAKAGCCIDFAELGKELHCYTNDTDTVIAHDQEEAWDVWLKYLTEDIGDNKCDSMEEYYPLDMIPDDQDIEIVAKTTKTAGQWAQLRGVGFLCTTEY